jgi:uncharacterized integral membrane protein
MLDRFRLIGAVLLTSAIIAFALQNLDPVDVTVLLWQFEAPVSLIALSTFLGGLVTGAAGMALRSRKAKKALKAEKKQAKEATALPKPPYAPPKALTATMPDENAGLSDADRKLLSEAGFGLEDTDDHAR